jgi:predicted amidohydrolase
MRKKLISYIGSGDLGYIVASLYELIDDDLITYWNARNEHGKQQNLTDAPLIFSKYAGAMLSEIPQKLQEGLQGLIDRTQDYLLGALATVLLEQFSLRAYEFIKIGGTRKVIAESGNHYWLSSAPRGLSGDWTVCRLDFFNRKIGRATAEWFLRGMVLVPTKVSGINVCFHSISDTLQCRLQAALMQKQRTIRLAIAPVGNIGRYRREWEFKPLEKTFFFLDRISGETQLLSCMKRLIEYCHQEQIAVLILPELSMSHELEDALREELKSKNNDIEKPWPLLVVAGSSHQPLDGSPYANISTVLDYRGRNCVLLPGPKEWIVAKRTEFPIQRKWIDKTTSESSEEMVVEPMELGDEITVVDTPIGRICVQICLDFIDPGSEELLLNLGISLFLVVAMSHSDGMFHARAEIMAKKTEAATIYANACRNDAPAPGAIMPSFAWLPRSLTPNPQRLKCAGHCLKAEPCIHKVILT